MIEVESIPTPTITHEHFEHSSDMASLLEALAKAQGDMKNPTCDSTNPHFKTSYASLAAVRDAVMPPLAANGLTITQLVGTAGREVICTTILWHSSGQYLRSTLRLPVSPAVPGQSGRRPPEEWAYLAALKYARRISLEAICNVCGDQDTDGETERESAAGVVRGVGERPWIERLQAQLVTMGTSDEDIQRYWRMVAHRYGEGISAALGEKLYGELMVKAAAKAKDVETSLAPVNAQTGELYDDEHPLVARINMLLDAQGVEIGARARYWARQDRKYAGRSEVTLGLMYKNLQEAAAKKRESAPETASDAPRTTNAPVSEQQKDGEIVRDDHEASQEERP